MTGVYNHTIDTKGRLFIPARLREELGEVFYITIAIQPCLTAYSLSEWEAMKAEVGAMPRSKQIKMRPLFAHAARCELDGQGRILIPQTLREKVGLTKNVAVVGSGLYTEIWDADAWAEIDAAETSPENMAKVFEELDF